MGSTDPSTTDIIADRDGDAGRDRRVDSDQRLSVLDSRQSRVSVGMCEFSLHRQSCCVDEKFVFQGPTQPTVVHWASLRWENLRTVLPAGLHHPRPQRGGSSRAAPVLVDDLMPHPGTRR